jgi:hypothetical protein
MFWLLKRVFVAFTVFGLIVPVFILMCIFSKRADLAEVPDVIAGGWEYIKAGRIP